MERHQAVEALRLQGITVGADAPAARLECTRIARLVLEFGVSRLGLVPSRDDVGVASVALALGHALSELRGPVGVIDAAATWGTARAFLGARELEVGPAATVWVGERLAVLVPRGLPAHVRQLKAVLDAHGGDFAELVVDLTGFDHLGEHLAAYELLDGVTVVARRGRTRRRELAARLDQVPPDLSLGVLVTGM